MVPNDCQATEKLLELLFGQRRSIGREAVSAGYLCLGKGFLTVLFVSLQLLDVDGVVAAVQLQEASKQGVGSLQLLQRPLILWQLVGIPSRPLSLEGVL